MKKTEKTFFVENLQAELESASSAVLIDYSGLSVKMLQDLKKRLKEVDSKMIVVKNTLFKLAGEKAKIPQETYSDTNLKGPIALVITEKDPIAPLQVISRFASEFELPHLKVGVVDKRFVDKEDLVRLSKLPSRQVLLNQVAGSILAPSYQVVSVLNVNLQNLVSILSQAAKKEKSN